jgi:hypothetical protein
MIPHSYDNPCGVHVSSGWSFVAKFVFWACFGVLLYVRVLYPLSLKLLAWVGKRRG